MDFLEKIVWNNSIKHYCIIALIILTTIIFNKYIARYIATLFYNLSKKIWKGVTKDSFTDLIVKPIKQFLLISISIFSLDQLFFPEPLKFIIYHNSFENIVAKLGIGIIIIFFIRLLLKLIDFIALVLEFKAANTTDRSDDQLVVFFRDFLKVIIFIIGLLLLLKACFNQNIGSILTGLSLVGAAMALAARESLENIIASFIIFFDKPFTTGDIVKMNTITGTVERIGLRSTRIRTVDTTLVSVPNKQMVDNMVDNYSVRLNRRAEIKLELAPATTSAVTEKFISTVHQYFLDNKNLFVSFDVHVADFTKNGLQITIEFLTPVFTIAEFNELKQQVSLAVKKIMEKNQINLSATAINNIIVPNDEKPISKSLI
jgi:MscS family membrane protein